MRATGQYKLVGWGMQGSSLRWAQNNGGNSRGLRKRFWDIQWCHWWPFENMQVGDKNQFYFKKKKMQKTLFFFFKLPYSKFLKTVRLEWLERNDWCFSLFWNIITIHLFSFKIPESTNTIMSYWNASSFSHWAYRKGIRITIIPDNQNKAGRNSLVVQCLGCCALTSEDWCSVTDWGIKIPQTEAQPKKRRKSR